MKLNIDTPTPEMNEQDAAKLDRDNVAALRKVINKTGVNQILLVETFTASAAISSASASAYEQLGPFQGVITCSGGWIEINFKTGVRDSGSSNTSFQLLVDGVVKDQITLSAGANEDLGPALHWAGPLGEGRHKVAVFYRTPVGTIIYSFNSDCSRLQAVETLL